ncbi:aromatic ring-hydroxylating oxygenase subunit alpha [Ferribacterium limneticum]|uniref:aromatic ring-hydroxylating oxygenase subunit alpha n=1 Tax=Ferribacterium limneticum TaxID=76259 RepID=UPI001CF80174|nr:aromatic ring-hydroxylating dioxygenase subunit alpha [Ferribacterium limneticum]UCV23612.1 aromatic ring-hydroxylating dioxygenase subunit alpha [Ferribacterium limneticum]
MSKAHEKFNDYQRGIGTELSPNWRDLAKADSKLVPEVLTRESSPNLGTGKIPPQNYTSYQYHRQEVEKVWKRTWQVACREEEIPNVGDHFVYEVAGLSFLVVRSAEKQFKAYWNVCLHRGRRLVDKSGCDAKSFRCGYHAWTWNIDGKLSYYPGEWDFPDVEPEKYNLREVLIDTWGGFIFINPDIKAGPLANHLGSLTKHFENWPLDKRFTLWHVQKTINANWKVALEAFLESYHLLQTHPQALSSVAEHGTQYDIYDEGEAHFSRSITPTGIPSKHAKNGSQIGAIADVWALLNALRADQAVELPPEITDRASISEWRRNVMKEMTGADYSTLSDAEMLDSVQYFLFPNFCPWYGEGLPLTYVFRPNADSPETSYFDVWMLIRSPDNGTPPLAAKTMKIGPDDHFEPIIGAMGLIFDQDDMNMPFVQMGMKTWPGDPVGPTWGRYQESRIRHLHQLLALALKRP